MIRILFVCLGNICRSPMAEAVFMHAVREAGLEGNIIADSAGTGDWHVGKPPHSGTRRLLTEKSIAWNHQARVITSRDLEEFDYIITMDSLNLQDVRALGSARGVVAGLMDYAPENRVREVPDPYYNGAFEEVYDLIHEAAAGLLASIRQAHKI